MRNCAYIVYTYISKYYSWYIARLAISNYGTAAGNPSTLIMHFIVNGHNKMGI